MRQFYLETDPARLPRPGDLVTLDQEESHHLFTVLRSAAAADLDLVDGRGNRLRGRLAGRQGKAARVEILTVMTDREESLAPRLVVACAVVKGKRFEWMLEKAVELGAHLVVPLITEFGVVDPRPGKRERWRTLMTAALKQSGRSWLPPLEEPQDLAGTLGRFSDDPVLYGALPTDASSAAGAFAADLPLPAEAPDSLILLVGPEGGWSPAERTLLAETGAQPVGLGPHVLRTETAAVVGLAALQALRDRWIQGSDA